MQIYRLSQDNQFFWNDGINFPSQSYLNSLQWTQLAINNVNMINSYELVEIVTDTPSNFFKIVLDNRTLYYMTRNFKIANGKYINLCEIDYWSSYLVNDSKFMSMNFNFIRYPNKDNLRWWDYQDPLLEPYKTSKKKIATHFYKGENAQWSKTEKYNSLFYAVFKMDYRAYRHSNDIRKTVTNLYWITRERQNLNDEIVNFHKIRMNSDFYIYVPITGFYKPTINFFATQPGPTVMHSEKITTHNNFEGICELIASPFFESRFEGIFCGPPLSALPRTNTVLKSIPTTENNFSYRPKPNDYSYGDNNYLAYTMNLGSSIDLSKMEFATPNLPDNYFYQIMDFELNNIKIDNILCKNFTNNVTKINTSRMTFTNKFITYLSKELIDHPLNFPHQMVSINSGYAAFIAGNSNSLDTGLKAQLASGILGSITGIAGLAGSIATGNVLGGVMSSISSVSNITSTITGMTQKAASARDSRHSAKNEVVGVVDEGPKLSVLNNWVNENADYDANNTFISKWNDYSDKEMQQLVSIVRDNGYYGMQNNNFKNAINSNKEVLFFQLADEESLKNYIVRDSFFNNISFKTWLRNTLLNGVRIWKTRQI